jgi:proteasome alpha subunit
MTYESPIDVNSLQHIQTGVQLYQVDPSGTFFRGAGFAIGQYSETALDVIQKGYNADMSVEQALQLSNKAIEKALGEEPLVETGVITTKDGSFKKL